MVKAAECLNAGQKLVWLELLELDQGGEEGAWLGAGGLAERLGFAARESIEQHRRDLCDLGLLASRQASGRRTASWYPTLPPECIPAGGRSRPEVDAIMRCARALDRHILARANGAAQCASQATGTTEQPAQSATPVRASGGVGGAPSSPLSSACETRSFPPVSSEGGESGAALARAEDEEAGEPGTRRYPDRASRSDSEPVPHDGQARDAFAEMLDVWLQRGAEASP